MNEQILILKDGIYERDNRISQLKKENQQLQNTNYVLTSSRKFRSPMNSREIINDNTLERTPSEKVIRPNELSRSPMQESGERLLTTHIYKNKNNEPASIENMNKEVYSINVGKWEGTNYRWKSMGLYKKETSDVQIETSLKRPSERILKEGVEKNMINKSKNTKPTIQSSLTGNWIPSLSLYTSPKHFTSSLRPKTTQLSLELATGKTKINKNENILIQKSIKSPEKSIKPLVPVSKGS